MNFAYTLSLPQPLETIWAALNDHISLIRCLPGCQAVEPAGDGDGGGAVGTPYRVRLTTGIGPIRLQVTGRAEIQSDDPARKLTARVNLGDARAGSIHGVFALTARPGDGGQNELRIEADVALAGKLGEFGTPLLRRKADQTVREFGENLKRQILGAAAT